MTPGPYVVQVDGRTSPRRLRGDRPLNHVLFSRERARVAAGELRAVDQRGIVLEMDDVLNEGARVFLVPAGDRVRP